MTTKNKQSETEYVTKADLKAELKEFGNELTARITETMKSYADSTWEKWAGVIQDTFAGTESRQNVKFAHIDKRFDAVDKRFDSIDKRLDTMATKTDISNLLDKAASNHRVDQLTRRVSALEQKAAI